MPANSGLPMQRREFLKLTGAITALSLTHSSLADRNQQVSIVVDLISNAQADCNPSSPVEWAAGRLQRAVARHGANCEIVPSLEEAADPSFLVVVGTAASPFAHYFPDA